MLSGATKQVGYGAMTNIFRRTGPFAAAVLFAATFVWQFQTADAGEKGAAEPMFMFVHTADDFEADPDTKTLRLVRVNPQVLFFSDRPQRLVGHLKMDGYLDEWTNVKDSFGEDPPNAALSVYEPKSAINTMAVVEIMNPIIDGNDIVYTYKLLDGTIPESGGETALFIDMIGIGGGVGVGYHGVGVGARGPGVTGWGGVGGPASGIGVLPGVGAGRAGVGLR